jgi:hypothetical protein
MQIPSGGNFLRGTNEKYDLNNFFRINQNIKPAA